MTELERLQTAKMYMDKLAQGIDPVTGREIPNDSILNNLHLARSFFYVSDILGHLIANGSVVCKKVKPLDFSITVDQLSCVKISKDPIRVKGLVGLITEAVGNPQMKPLSTTVITDWLLKKGFLEKRIGLGGESRRLPTQAGMRLGIFTQAQQGRDGMYESVYYSPEAQRFVVDNLPAILSER